MRKCVLIALATVAVAGGVATPAAAEEALAGSAWPSCASEQAQTNPWNVTWAPAQTGIPAGPAVTARFRMHPAAAGSSDQTTAGRARPIAFEYSEGYKIRAKIHKIASIATLPLFVAEYLVGTNLYNHPGTASDSARSAHSALAASTGVLFGINTVTGVWNLIEARKDPNRRAKRTIHGILMLIADAGFLATAATAPESEHGSFESEGSRSTHRALAITSMGIATVSYLVMLLGGD